MIDWNMVAVSVGTAIGTAVVTVQTKKVIEDRHIKARIAAGEDIHGPDRRTEAQELQRSIHGLAEKVDQQQKDNEAHRLEVKEDLKEFKAEIRSNLRKIDRNVELLLRKVIA